MKGQIFKYKSRYGELELITIEEFRPVNQIRVSDVPDWVMINMDTAAKIALLTGNVRIQICISDVKYGAIFLIVHQDFKTAAVAAIRDILFDDQINPEEEIKRLRKIDKSVILN